MPRPQGSRCPPQLAGPARFLSRDKGSQAGPGSLPWALGRGGGPREPLSLLSAVGPGATRPRSLRLLSQTGASLRFQSLGRSPNWGAFWALDMVGDPGFSPLSIRNMRCTVKAPGPGGQETLSHTSPSLDATFPSAQDPKVTDSKEWGPGGDWTVAAYPELPRAARTHQRPSLPTPLPAAKAPADPSSWPALTPR